MRIGALAHETDFEGWRSAARQFRMGGLRPDQVRFAVGGETAQSGLFDIYFPPTPVVGKSAREFVVPKAFVDVAGSVILHRSEDRFDLLYRLLWRL
ncbi:MAG TPA: uracil-DNA glycosylase, partial [Brevundimonas sp.]|nr:uracil-DNA glycosylase [Brevundimonas sp.]